MPIYFAEIILQDRRCLIECRKSKINLTMETRKPIQSFYHRIELSNPIAKIRYGAKRMCCRLPMHENAACHSATMGSDRATIQKVQQCKTKLITILISTLNWKYTAWGRCQLAVSTWLDLTNNILEPLKNSKKPPWIFFHLRHFLLNLACSSTFPLPPTVILSFYVKSQLVACQGYLYLDEIRFK